MQQPRRKLFQEPTDSSSEEEVVIDLDSSDSESDVSDSELPDPPVAMSAASESWADDIPQDMVRVNSEEREIYVNERQKEDSRGKAAGPHERWSHDKFDTSDERMSSGRKQKARKPRKDKKSKDGEVELKIGELKITLKSHGARTLEESPGRHSSTSNTSPARSSEIGSDTQRARVYSESTPRSQPSSKNPKHFNFPEKHSEFNSAQPIPAADQLGQKPPRTPEVRQKRQISDRAKAQLLASMERREPPKPIKKLVDAPEFFPADELVTVQQMVTPSGQIVFMTEDGLMISADYGYNEYNQYYTPQYQDTYYNNNYGYPNVPSPTTASPAALSNKASNGQRNK